MKLKIMVSLLLLTLLFASISGFNALPISAQLTTIEWLTCWTDPSELRYWSNVTAEYEALHPEVDIVIRSVPFADLWHAIFIYYPWDKYPDMIHIPSAWVPEAVGPELLAIPPADVQADVAANWTDVAVDSVTYLYTIWGYPTELTGEALVYNERILNQTVGYENIPEHPWTWDQLKSIAINTTQWIDERIDRPGLWFFSSPPYWPRFTFVELLWSNGGKEYSLAPPAPDREILFNGTDGVEVLQFCSIFRNVTYDPDMHPVDPYGFFHMAVTAIVPSWYYLIIKGAMGDHFTDLRIAPIPIGPSGAQSYSHVYTWLNVVTQAAKDKGKAEACWDFLRWLNKPQSDAAPYGVQPEAHNVSRMGDFLIYDGVYASRISDIENSQAYISQEFWLKSFGEIATTHGRADEYFVGYEEYSREISVNLCEPVMFAGADPKATADAVAAEAIKNLPIPGDVNHDDIVDIFDLVTCTVALGSKLGDPNWDRRADVNGDGVVDIFDLVIIGGNLGRRDF